MADPQTNAEIARLVADHHQAAYRYAYRLTGSVQDAEDLTQEMFLIAYRKIGQLRDVDKAKPWLFAILRNCFLKNRKRLRPFLAGDMPLDNWLIHDAHDRGETDTDQLQNALEKLPETSKFMLLMYYFEECSYRQIAERLDLPIGTVMSRLSRAKEYLREILFPPEFELPRKPTRNQMIAKRGDADAKPV